MFATVFTNFRHKTSCVDIPARKRGVCLGLHVKGERETHAFL